MNFFEDRKLDNYWFNSGTPAFLIDLIRRRNNMDSVLRPIVVDSSVFKEYDPVNISEVPLMFQTGYLTIKQMELTPEGVAEYTLDIPNMEVNKSLMTHLLKACGKYSDEREFDELRKTMRRHIIACDESGFAGSLEKMIGTVPYQIHINHEYYYHSLLLMWLRLFGFKVRAEEPNNFGRSDIVWEQSGLTVVVEIKYSPPPEEKVEEKVGKQTVEKKINALLNEALNQIHERRYYNKYSGKILLLGVAFFGRQSGCRMEILNMNTQ
jgi:hypothetical protein